MALRMLSWQVPQASGCDHSSSSGRAVAWQQQNSGSSSGDLSPLTIVLLQFCCAVSEIGTTEWSVVLIWHY
jgi:hypothetical protein